MKKKLYIVTVLFAIVFVAMTSCDDYASYAEQRDYELSALSRFINNPSFGEIKGKKINVISEEEFLKDTITDVSKNEFVRFNNGIYMQIVRRGCGNIMKDGESATVISRFREYNINGDSLQLWNDDVYYGQQLYEKFEVRRASGTFNGMFCTVEDSNTTLHGQMYRYGARTYGTNSIYHKIVPMGLLMPLSYVKLGRPANDGDEIAKVRLILPHDQGQAEADRYVYACYYEITYEKGI